MSKNDTFPFWSDEWMKSQQGYMDSWTEMSQKMSETFQPRKKPRNPWIEALEQWESIVPGSSDAQPYAHRMLSQGKAFFQMAEEISTFMKMVDDVNKSTDEWKQTLENQMEDLKGAFEKGQGDLAAFWDQPLTAWKDMLGDQTIDPQDFLKLAGSHLNMDMNMDELTNPVYEGMDKLLSTPGVGPDREAHEQQRRYSKLWMDYQRTFHEYNSAHHTVGKETIERLKAKAIELSERGETLDSMRDVYDLWIDCAEDAYADFAYSDEYQEIYGRMINSQMALKKETRNMVDSMATSIGLPSSRGFDTVLKRMQEMRREIRQLKKSIQQSPAQSSKGTDNSKVLKEMRAEINALRKEVADLNKADGKKPTTTKKKVVRKKTAASKTTK